MTRWCWPTCSGCGDERVDERRSQRVQKGGEWVGFWGGREGLNRQGEAVQCQGALDGRKGTSRIWVAAWVPPGISCGTGRAAGTANSTHASITVLLPYLSSIPSCVEGGYGVLDFLVGQTDPSPTHAMPVREPPKGRRRRQGQRPPGAQGTRGSQRWPASSAPWLAAGGAYVDGREGMGRWDIPIGSNLTHRIMLIIAR